MSNFQENVLRNTPQFVGEKRTLIRRIHDIFLHHLRHFVVEIDEIERPALVRTRHFLSHGRQESLRVEEARHPEYVRPTLEDPREELGVPIEQVREPETERRGLPRDLKENGDLVKSGCR